ncbi:hypothetical protein FACS1894208_07060 [Clostridia bacterium]|nr:hypothetical protein FACS1894208_07060 [Clostridia bacterium]
MSDRVTDYAKIAPKREHKIGGGEIERAALSNKFLHRRAGGTVCPIHALFIRHTIKKYNDTPITHGFNIVRSLDYTASG